MNKPLQLMTRTPLQRIQAIHNQLSSNRYPNCSKISKLFEVNPKTIQRDIDFMKYNWNLPIEYNNRCRGFYYTEEVKFLPTSTFNISEFLALKHILKHLPSTSFQDVKPQLGSVISKISYLNGFPDNPEAA